MANPESKSATDSDGTADHEQDERLELETLTRKEDWGGEAFRDAGEATFGD